METDNRNPYHNYGDLEKLGQSIDEVNDKLKSFTFLVPFRNSDRLITPNDYFYGKTDYNFNVSLTKQTMKDKNILRIPTKDFFGEVNIKTETEDCKYTKKGKLIQRKKGNPTFNPTTRKWEYQNMYPVFKELTDIQTFFEYFKEYRQITCGLGHNERQIIVCDFDKEKDKDGNVIPNQLVPYNENTISLLEDICNEYNIPHFTYLERHMDSNNFQIGWILDRPIHWINEEKFSKKKKDEMKQTGKKFKNYYKDLFDNIRRTFSVVFHSDPRFGGWWIKNPNCVHLTETQWFNDTVKLEDFLTSFNNLDYNYDIFVQTQKPSIPMDEISSVTIDTYDDDNFCDDVTPPKKTYVKTEKEKDSRNVYIRDTLRDWIWKYRKNSGDFPTDLQISVEGERLSQEIGNKTKKGQIPNNELEGTIKSVTSFCKTNYVEIFNDRQRKLGDIVKRQIKEDTLLNVFLLKKSGMKNKDIQKKLDISKSNLDKKIRYIKDYEFSFYSDEEDTYHLVDNSHILLNFMYFYEHPDNLYTQRCERTIKMYEDNFPIQIHEGKLTL